MKTVKCKFCGKETPNNMQGYCQSCYKYFITQKKCIYPIPKDGVVQYTAEGDCICHECGMAYRKLGGHICQCHGMTTEEYKKKHGIYLRSTHQRLCNPDYSIFMKKIQDPKTISENLIEKGTKTRFYEGWSNKMIRDNNISHSYGVKNNSQTNL